MHGKRVLPQPRANDTRDHERLGNAHILGIVLDLHLVAREPIGMGADGRRLGPHVARVCLV